MSGKYTIRQSSFLMKGTRVLELTSPVDEHHSSHNAQSYLFNELT